jgi:hypothetical protein
MRRIASIVLKQGSASGKMKAAERRRDFPTCRRTMDIVLCAYVFVLLRNGKGVIVYPNPLVADLMASGIANRITFLRDRRVQPNADLLTALARLETELDEFASAVRSSIEFLEGRSFGLARGLSQHVA